MNPLLIAGYVAGTVCTLAVLAVVVGLSGAAVAWINRARAALRGGGLR